MDKRLDEYLPPEFWDALYKPRGPLGLFSGRTALSFVPGLSQGLDAVDTKNAYQQGDALGVGMGLFGMLTGPVGKAGIIAGRKGMERLGTYIPGKVEQMLRDLKLRGSAGEKLPQSLKDEYASKLGIWPESTQAGKVAASEISDAWMMVSDKAAAASKASRESGIGSTLALPEVITHPELFKAYPELAKFKVVFDPSLKSTGAMHADTIMLGPKASYGTILHELQHHIQKVEGFDPGFGHYESYLKQALDEGVPPDQAQDMAWEMWKNNYGEQMAETVSRRYNRIQSKAEGDPRLMEREYKKSRVTEREGEPFSLDEANRDMAWDSNSEVNFSKLLEEFAASR